MSLIVRQKMYHAIYNIYMSTFHRLDMVNCTGTSIIVVTHDMDQLASDTWRSRPTVMSGEI